MISQLRGKVISKKNFEILLDVNGVGYSVSITKKLFESLDSDDSEKVIMTYLDVKETGMNLYGFSGEAEREIFKMLMNVNGISAKSAHTILSYTFPEDLIQFIMDKRNAALIKIPGIGTKKLDLIYVTLHDRISKISQNIMAELSPEAAGGTEQPRFEAMNALLNLGYSRSEAERLIREVLKSYDGREYTTGDLVKAALEII
ncbi:MAG TPA: Holliday junction branch migration protein RuvA [Ignavibacteria bacterium]|nr:Holliday junction branch migration protein RuvA [Ignavibacteria bacterium]